MAETALAEALRSLEGVLQEEARSPMSEALAERKEKAVALLQALLQGPLDLDEAGLDPVAARLRDLLAANRYSLKWNGLRAQLARIGQPKPEPPVSRPRLDLVH